MENSIEKLFNNLSKDYIFDLYLVNFTVIEGVNLHNREIIVENTIQKYRSYHPNFQNNFNNNIKEYFLKIIKNDTVINFENILIYKELYKILNLINNTLQVQQLLNDSKKYPHYFGKIQSDRKQIKSFRNHNKKNLIGLTKLQEKRQSRLRTWYLNLYLKNKRLTKYFIHLFIISDIVKIKEIYKKDKESEIFLQDLEFFLMQKTSISKVVKSLGILLYYELIEFLKFSRDEAEEISSHIIYLLFRENLNTEEFNKVIEINSSVGFYPIFTASKKTSFQNKEKIFIMNQLYQEVLKYVNIPKPIFKHFFNSFMQTLHIQYLHKYPVELLRRNPKYSSLSF